ncbi:hypothetical protein AO1008_11557 [Aspergillus oryzae 100-8]|uniref:Rhodopsin domain-containing protein n=2 Tax=Aspergillus subgen. Circumdati TaxID=2720871 RepID=I8I6G4_ASPO3|nr:hypothetical protein Ao3042_01328 [Aspergillus oryzae 3.042]KDE75160.1 hypothetical protein AO1008_11557 [Aspergillus oryzae 100-8]|eukprot:EIT72321.1 hypothetical protein Ao3042_01328 [Aspergillus oryzae 3.042]
MERSTVPSDDGDVSRATMVTVPTIATTIIALILTLLRLYVRRYMIRMLSWDDWFNVFAMLTQLVVLGLVLGATSYGFGRHVKYVGHDHATYSMKLLRICEFLLIFTTVFLKISISLFLKRLFLTSKKWRVFFWCFIAFNTITSVLDAAVIFPQCTPVELNWDKSVEGHCWSANAIDAIGITQGAIAASTDFALSILPIVFLWNIKLPKRVKVGICGIMALGFASGAFAIARTVLVPSLMTTEDPTWDLVDLFMWAVLEATFGIIAAAAPSVRPLLGHNSVTTNYYSRDKSHSLPLRTTRTGRTSRIEWGHTVFDTRNDPDERDDYGGDSESQLRLDDRGIMKTTSIEVVTTLGHTVESDMDGRPTSEESTERRYV